MIKTLFFKLFITVFVSFFILNLNASLPDNTSPDTQRKWLENMENQRKDENRRWERERQDRIRQQEADRRNQIESDRIQARKEQERRLKEERKEMERKCEEADRNVREALKEAKEQQSKLEEEFYDLEEKITDLEKKKIENQNTIKEKIDNLKKETNQSFQDFKDQMGDELKAVEQQASSLENNFQSLFESLQKTEEERMSVFYSERKQQNEFYNKCFDSALKQVQTEKLQITTRAKAGLLKRKTMGSLFSGTKKNTKDMFQARFKNFLNLCLHGEQAQRVRTNQQNAIALANTKLLRQEARTKSKMKQIENQIQQLNTTGKTEIMKKFKERMQAKLKEFNEVYTSLTEQQQQQKTQIMQEINKIKQQQAYVLTKRSQIVPEDTRSMMINNQCQAQMNALNLFPFGNRSNSGMFNSAPSYGTSTVR